jgi:RNA polymerase sigma-70 factor (ECF subfamily)
MPTSPLEDRLRSLLEEYGHLLRRAIRRVAPREMELEMDDIEQEARLRVWRALQKETVLEQPASYFYRVAVNATLNAVRSRQARREEPLAGDRPTDQTAAFHSDSRQSPSPSPEKNAALREELAGVQAALSQLPENRRRAVKLHLQGFTTREIGEFYDWTEAKARNLAYRGLDDLRRLLKAEGGSLDDREAN